MQNHSALTITSEELYALSANYHAAKDLVAFKTKPTLADYKALNDYSAQVEELVFNPINAAWDVQFEEAMRISDEFLNNIKAGYKKGLYNACSAHQARLQVVCERASELSGQLCANTITVLAWAEAQAKLHADMDAVVRNADVLAAF